MLGEDDVTVLPSGVRVVNVPRFRARPVDLLRLVLAPLSDADVRAPDPPGAPLDVSLVVTRARDGRRTIEVAGWRVGAENLHATIARYAKADGWMEVELDGIIPGAVALATRPSESIYWTPADGYCTVKDAIYYGRLQATFGDFVVDLVADAVHGVQRAGAQLDVAWKRAREIDDEGSPNLAARVSACASLLVPIHALFALPAWLRLDDAATLFQSTTASVERAHLLMFLADTIDLCAEDAPRPLGSRFRKEALPPVAQLASAFEHLDTGPSTASFHALRLRMEGVLEKRWVDASGNAARRRWFTPSAWE